MATLDAEVATLAVEVRHLQEASRDLAATTVSMMLFDERGRSVSGQLAEVSGQLTELDRRADTLDRSVAALSGQLSDLARRVADMENRSSMSAAARLGLAGTVLSALIAAAAAVFVASH